MQVFRKCEGCGVSVPARYAVLPLPGVWMCRRCWGEFLAELLEDDVDPGSEAVLAAHARRREEDRRRTLEFSHGLALATTQSSALARPLRSAGLLAAARLPSLQGWLVGGAMGYRGVVPRLCRAPPAGAAPR